MMHDWSVDAAIQKPTTKNTCAIGSFIKKHSAAKVQFFITEK